uniref:Uncharacterized protein n=1 Tax=Rhizophora mucronata TaxID=61149 RepID=A0A2P2QSS1_RHIMU
MNISSHKKRKKHQQLIGQRLIINPVIPMQLNFRKE